MRKFVLAILLNCIFFTTYAQTDGVQIDYSVTPPARSSSALLELNSATQGFLPPRVALVANNNSAAPVNAPADGLIVYNTATSGTAPNNVTPGLYMWNGTVSLWQKLSAGAALGYIENRAVDNVFATGQSASFDITGNGELGGTLDVGGQTAIGTVTPAANTMLTINAHGTNTQRNGMDITLTSPGANATGINITSAEQQARGLMYSNSTNGLTNVVWGTGAELTTTNIVSGYTGYRNSSGVSYGVYGVNGTSATYATNASTWAAFLQGRTVISSESTPTSPLGVDLEVRNTTTGAAAPATVQLRQTTPLTTNGNVLANIDFGDNHQATGQARIQAIRGAAGGAGDLPSSLLFYTTPDASAAMAERLRIASNGNVGINTTTPGARLDIASGADNNGTGDQYAIALQYRTGGYRHFIRSRHNSAVTAEGNDIDFFVNNNATAVGSSAPGTGNIHVLTLESYNSTPRVGIGTTAPNSPLTVRTTVATANARTTSLSNAIGDVLFELATSKGATTNAPGDVTTQIGQAYNGGTISEGIRFFRGGGATDGAMAFLTNAGTERMRINNAGTVSVNSLAGTGSRFVLADASGNLSAGTSIGTGIVTGTGTTDYLARWTSASTLGTGATIDNGTDVGIGMAPGTYKLSVAGNTFTSGKYFGHLNVDDTRAVNTAPTGYNNEVAFDFKLLSTIGAPGSGNYGGLITMAPWGDNSGDASHQLFLNEGGIYWRQGQPDDAAWGSWDRVVTESMGDADYIQNQTAGAQTGAGFWTSGTGRTNGTLTGGGTTVISSDNIQVNDGGSGNRFAYIDLEGDDTYTDYGFRLIRENTGPNTNTSLVHRGTGNLQITTNEAAPMLFSTSSAERMRITPTGNVGIGTTVPTLGRLQLNAGDIAIRLSENAGSQSNAGHANLGSITFYGHNRGSGNNSAKIRVGSTTWDDAGYFAFETSTDGADAAERMRITEAGNVGIGTTAPAANMLLDVNGSMLARKYVVQDAVDGTNARGIWMWDEGDSNWGIYMSTSGAGKSLANGTATTGAAGAASHAIRIRTYSDAANSFIYENSLEQVNFSVRASDGLGLFRGNVGVGGVGTNYIARGTTAAGRTWDPSNGVIVANDENESGGFFANGNTAAIWSPGDNVGILSVHDEDDIANPRMVVNGSGKVEARYGLQTRKSYYYFTRTATNGAAAVHSIGVYDVCFLAAFSEYIDEDDGDQSHDLQCNVYHTTSGMHGDGVNTQVTNNFDYNQKPDWQMYIEAYGSKTTRQVTCSAMCITFDY